MAAAAEAHGAVAALAMLADAGLPLQHQIDRNGDESSESDRRHTELAVDGDACGSGVSLATLRRGLETRFPTLLRALETPPAAAAAYSAAQLRPTAAAEGETAYAAYARYGRRLLTAAAGDVTLGEMMAAVSQGDEVGTEGQDDTSAVWLPPACRELLQLAAAECAILPAGDFHGVDNDETAVAAAAAAAAAAECAAWERLGRRLHPTAGESTDGFGEQLELLLCQGRPLAALEWFLQSRDGSAAEETTVAASASAVGHERSDDGSAAAASLPAIETTPTERLEQPAPPSPSSRKARNKKKSAAKVSEATTTALAALDDVDAETLRRRVEPLACLSYHRPHVVAACCALLELCGLSAWGVRVDCAALRRVARHLSASAQPHAVRVTALLHCGQMGYGCGWGLAGRGRADGVAPSGPSGVVGTVADGRSGGNIHACRGCHPHTRQRRSSRRRAPPPPAAIAARSRRAAETTKTKTGPPLPGTTPPCRWRAPWRPTCRAAVLLRRASPRGLTEEASRECWRHWSVRRCTTAGRRRRALSRRRRRWRRRGARRGRRRTTAATATGGRGTWRREAAAVAAGCVRSSHHWTRWLAWRRTPQFCMACGPHHGDLKPVSPRNRDPSG